MKSKRVAEIVTLGLVLLAAASGVADETKVPGAGPMTGPASKGETKASGHSKGNSAPVYDPGPSSGGTGSATSPGGALVVEGRVEYVKGKGKSPGRFVLVTDSGNRYNLRTRRNAERILLDQAADAGHRIAVEGNIPSIGPEGTPEFDVTDVLRVERAPARPTPKAEIPHFRLEIDLTGVPDGRRAETLQKISHRLENGADGREGLQKYRLVEANADRGYLVFAAEAKLEFLIRYVFEAGIPARLIGETVEGR